MQDLRFCYILYCMNTRYNKRTKLALGFAIIFVIIGLYLNRAYAHIYNTIGAAGLEPVNPAGKHLIVNNMTTTTSLAYVALGDSLSAGAGTDTPEHSLPYILAEKMAGKGQKVVFSNYSVPGFKTADLLNELLIPAIDAKPEVVTLLIGVNDIHNQVSASGFEKNYDQILSRLTKETKAKIYVISIPFIGARGMMLPPYQFYFDSKTREFNAIIKKLAVEYSVSYIDLYTPSVNLFKSAGSHYSVDLFHPSAAGYKIWADIIYDHFNQ